MRAILSYSICLLLLVYACRTGKETYVRAAKPSLVERVTFGQPNLPTISAHRGGRYYAGYPENSIELFAYTAGKARAIIECDVSMSKDSVLFLMHDWSLDRTTTGEGKVAEKNWADMKDLKLEDDFGTLTSYTIPTLDQTLSWAKNKVWLSLDIKRGVPFSMVVDAINTYNASSYAAIITYNIDAAKEVYKLAPNVLISAGIRNIEDLKRYKESGIPMKNLIAFTGTKEPDPAVYKALHEEGIVCMLGTLGNLDKRVKAKGNDKLYENYVKKGADILATDRPLEAAKVLENWRKQTRK
ncbi:MAG: glycerophosphodiester phosphodiesterase family protein [Bacteroidota bacterium]